MMGKDVFEKYSREAIRVFVVFPYDVHQANVRHPLGRRQKVQEAVVYRRRFQSRELHPFGLDR
jgi:hypothetical protein